MLACKEINIERPAFGKVFTLGPPPSAPPSLQHSPKSRKGAIKSTPCIGITFAPVINLGLTPDVTSLPTKGAWQASTITVNARPFATLRPTTWPRKQRLRIPADMRCDIIFAISVVIIHFWLSSCFPPLFFPLLGILSLALAFNTVIINVWMLMTLVIR